MICYSSPGMIKGGLPESSFMTPLSPQESRTVKGKENRIQNPASLMCFPLPPPHFSLLEGSGERPSRALLFPSPAEPLSSPRQQQMVPGLPLPTLLGGANLRLGRQRAEEDLLAGQADPPPSAIKLKTLRLSDSSDHPRLPPRSPNSSSPSAPFPTPSRSPPPATLTRAGSFTYLHMQIITFA